MPCGSVAPNEYIVEAISPSNEDEESLYRRLNRLVRCSFCSTAVTDRRGRMTNGPLSCSMGSRPSGFLIVVELGVRTEAGISWKADVVGFDVDLLGKVLIAS